jgi:nucleolar complex protein 3
MVSKRKGKLTKKIGHLKVSAAKLSNKRLNRLAKQGKLKRILGRKKLQKVVGNRVYPTQKNSASSHENDGKQLAEVDADEIPLEEADYEYFARPGRDFHFLSDMDRRKRQEAPRKRKPNDEDDDAVDHLEVKYAKRLANHNHESGIEVKSLLPIKCKTLGVIRRTIEVPKVSATEEADVPEAMEDGYKPTKSAKSSSVPTVPQNPAAAYIQHQLQVAEAKEKIAELCMAVISLPEENIGKLKELRSFLGDVTPDIPLTIRKLAALSLMEVFKDIIPEYRIRVVTDTEKHQKMKKDTKKLVGFEEALVNNYRHYLETLETMTTGKPVKRKFQHKGTQSELTDAAAKSLRVIAIRCLCELLTSHPHFNYRSNIIALVVPFLAKRDAQLSDMVIECIRQLFAEDKAGDVTLEVVRLIGRVIKAKKFAVHPKVLATFLSLKVKEVAKSGEEEEKPRKMTRDERFKQFSKRERKRQKQMAHLEKELQDAAVEDNTKRRLRLNTEIINTVFLTYFRILKTGRRSPLLSVVLEGLSKFAHLINVSFFDDLFAVMTDLVDSGELKYRESLHCIQTAFSLLSGLGASLNIDPMRFYSHLYRTLFHLHAGQSSVDLPIALQCLDILIGRRRRQVPPPRVLAFVKRLSTLALQMNCHGSLALLALIKNIMAEHLKCDVLLETESFGSGDFLPELDEPDLCNAHNTALYELHLLKRSFHPSVRQFADFILKSKDSRNQLPPELAHSSPVELFNLYDTSSTMEFKPKLRQLPAVNRKQGSSGALAFESSELFAQAMAAVADVRENVDKINFFADLSDVARM